MEALKAKIPQISLPDLSLLLLGSLPAGGQGTRGPLINPDEKSGLKPTELNMFSVNTIPFRL
jgi:hypothetical protein